MSNLRIGVLGGTFDPLHLGHLVVASEVTAAMALDRMLLVPAHRQPFKEHDGFASPMHRLRMCEAAAAGQPWLDVSDVDLVRGGVTYTVDTLTDLATLYPGADLFFVAGADSIAQLGSWKEPERLLTLARFVGVTRPGHAGPSLPAPHQVVEVPQVGVSSTDVRRRLAAGAPVRYLVPDLVAAYIDEHHLYLGGPHV